MGQRTLQWDMKAVHPGLRMRIGPSLGTNGLLEFYIDPAFQYDERTYDEPQSTGIILYFVPYIYPSKYNPMTSAYSFKLFLPSAFNEKSFQVQCHIL